MSPAWRATVHRTAYRTCPLCEATCGLELTLDGERVIAIRGDADDVFSHGFVCPKGAALKQLHEDPDCVTTPLVRDGDGFRGAGWDEAFALIDERLSPILAADRNAVAVYLGNPTVHNLSGTLYAPVLLRALSTRNVFTASTVDQMPKQLACALMFGTGTTVPVPDVDRTEPPAHARRQPAGLQREPDDGAGHARASARAPRPRRQAGRHRPAPDAHGGDGRRAPLHPARHRRPAAVCAGPCPVRRGPGRARASVCDELTAGLDEVRALAEPFTPEAVADVCGVAADEIRRMAHELAAAPRAAVYGRIGTCTQEFGTLASWLVDVLNLLTGNLDRVGGAMFPLAAAGHSNAAGEPRRGRGARMGRFASRVRGLPEVFGELPVACLAEEIDTPGEGQVRALITLAGNPVALDAQQRPPGRGAAIAGVHGQPRRLRQRDDPPRRRHPARPLAPAPRPLRRRAVPVRGP